MSSEFKWKHFPQPVYLYIPNDKFWEISYIGTNLLSFYNGKKDSFENLEIRFGKLLADGTEASVSVKAIQPQLKGKISAIIQLTIFR